MSDIQPVAWRAPLIAGGYEYFDYEPIHLPEYEPLYPASVLDDFEKSRRHADRMFQAHQRALGRQLDAEVDASRYRWLRDDSGDDLCVRLQGSNPIHTHLPAYYVARGKKLDDAIDVLMRKEP